MPALALTDACGVVRLRAAACAGGARPRATPHRAAGVRALERARAGCAWPPVCAELARPRRRVPRPPRASVATTDAPAAPRQIPSYGIPEWERHRHISRYFRHFTSIPSSHILANLLPPAIFSMVSVLLLVLYDTFRASSWPALSGLGLGPLGLSSSALSLLLVFRTNTSYQRFDEARRLWGSMVNRSRDLVRQALVWFPASRAPLKRALVRWVVALAHSVRLHSRAPRDATPAALAGWLSPDELAGLAAAQHRPNHCLQVLSRIVEAGAPDAHVAHRLDEDLKFLEDTIGGIERVYRTPIPLSYTRHTSRLLLFWLFYMPAALFSELRWHALLVAPLLVLVLFGIDEIGVELEEPFSILPLEVLCDAIKAQGLELLASDDDIAAMVAGYSASDAPAA